jgi:hypothetical protein
VAFSSDSLEGGVGRIENACQNSTRRHRTVVRFESTRMIVWREVCRFSDLETECNSHDYSGEYGSYHGEQDVRAAPHNKR